MSGPDGTQNGAATPPPPPPSGSPFGRFIQHPVLLVGLVALMVSLPLIALSVDGGGTNSGPPASTAPTPDPDLLGAWQGRVSGPSGRARVRLEIASAGSRMRRASGAAACEGRLTPTSDPTRFAYAETSGDPACPPRTTVRLVPNGEVLRFEESGGDIAASGTLRRPRAAASAGSPSG